MKLRLIIAVTLILLVFPFCLNLAGCDLFLNFHLGEKSIVFACSKGGGHFAITERFSDISLESYVIYSEYYMYAEIINLGYFDLSAEFTPDRLQLFSFYFFDGDYYGFQYPWLINFIFPLVLILSYRKHKKARDLDGVE